MYHRAARCVILSLAWASYQIRKIAGCACTGNAGRFPRHRLRRKPLVIDPGMHQGTCVMHVPWYISGSLTRGGGEIVPRCIPEILFWIMSLGNQMLAAVIIVNHDDVIPMENFPRYWSFTWGIQRSLVNSPHNGQWRGALMFYLICAWTNCWANNRSNAKHA